jgi:uncharacterized protein YfeS
MRKFETIWDVTRESAHPRAKQLLGQSVIWDYGDEDSPLGNDVGADTFAAYLKFRDARPTRGLQDFIREELEFRELPDVDWDLLDEARLAKLLEVDRGYAVLKRDDFIVGLAFAQLLLEGALDPVVRQRATTALCRQAMDAILAFRGGGGQDARKKQLVEFRRILESVQ